jgi:hypothetical protein
MRTLEMLTKQLKTWMAEILMAKRLLWKDPKDKKPEEGVLGRNVANGELESKISRLEFIGAN